MSFVVGSLVVGLLPAAAQAQLSVLAPGASLTVNPTNSSSYIEVTGTDANGAQVCSNRCEPNVTSCTCGAPAANVSSRLVYDPLREKLMLCNGETPPSETADCSKASGIVKATMHLRVGKIKVLAKTAPGYSGLPLSTADKSARLEFEGSAEDAWYASYGSNSSSPRNVGAGSYRVFASDLSAHCLPTQTNPGVEVTVPEGGEAQVEVLFKGTQCTLTVKRTLSTGSPGGTVQTTPEGLTCGASPTSSCTGTFAYGTALTLTPMPESNGGYSFLIGDGCIPTNEPCKHTIGSDRTFNVNFGAPKAEPPDAGVAPSDAGTMTSDAAAGSDGNDGSSLADAGSPPGDGTSDGSDGASDGANDGSDGTAGDDGSVGDEGAAPMNDAGASGDEGVASGDDGVGSGDGDAEASEEGEGGGSGCSLGAARSNRGGAAGFSVCGLVAALWLARRARRV